MRVADFITMVLMHKGPENEDKIVVLTAPELAFCLLAFGTALESQYKEGGEKLKEIADMLNNAHIEPILTVKDMVHTCTTKPGDNVKVVVNGETEMERSVEKQVGH